jgi:hypothetical protein
MARKCTHREVLVLTFQGAFDQPQRVLRRRDAPYEIRLMAPQDRGPHRRVCAVSIPRMTSKLN